MSFRDDERTTASKGLSHDTCHAFFLLPHHGVGVAVG
jgi:hypothetical protein